MSNEDDDKIKDNSATEPAPPHSDSRSPKSEVEVESALERISQKRPEIVTEMMAMVGAGSAPNPIHKKMTPEHITQVLDLAAKHDEREYNLHKTAQSNTSQDETSIRRYAFAAFVVLVLLVVVVLFLFKNTPNVLVPILTGIGGLAGGFMGGWGFGRTKG